MKKDELCLVLINKGILWFCYLLEGGLFNEKFCLDYENSKWVVYYFECGIKIGI